MNYNTIEKMINSVLLFNETKKEISNELSKIDKKINEITHIIEFNDFNMQQTFKLIKKKKVLLEKRRSIKEEIHKFDVFKHHKNKLFNDTLGLKTIFEDLEIARIEKAPSKELWKNKKDELLK